MKESELADKVVAFLKAKYKTEINQNKYEIVREVEWCRHKFDISLIDVESRKIKAIYELKARTDDSSVKMGKIEIMEILSIFDESIEAFLVIPNNKNKMGFDLIKVKKNKYTKAIDEFKRYTEVLALLTFIMLVLSEVKVIVLDSNLIISGGVIIVLLLAPRVQEISFLGLTIKRLERDLKQEQDR